VRPLIGAAAHGKECDFVPVGDQRVAAGEFLVAAAAVSLPFAAAAASVA
jgi:hypothetical protein